MRALHPVWQDYRRRRRWFWSAVALTFGLMFVVAGFLEEKRIEGHPIGLAWSILLGVSVVLPMLAAQRWLYAFQCPRCGRPFLRRRGSVTRACASCGFAKWGDPDTFA